MLVIGLTGGVGTGKSTVAAMLAARGAAVIDADRIVHALLAPGAPAARRIARAFGRGVLARDGAVDRKALARIVFADPAARKRLERITHPAVFKEIRRRLAALRRANKVRAVVVEVPLLFETGADRLVDVTVVVTAPAGVQRRRLRVHAGWSAQEVRSRIRAQWHLSAKVALADEVIDNGGRVQETRRQVESLWQKLVGTPRHRRSRSSTSPR